MIKVLGGRSLKLLYAFLTLFVHLKPALGFTSGVGNGSVLCIEKERQALLEFRKGFVEGHRDRISSWDNEDGKDCCNWFGVYCNNQTGHVIGLDLDSCGLRGTQIQTINSSGFIGNLALCGPPLTPNEYCKIAKDVSRLRNTALSLKGLDNKKKLCPRLRV
nr:putative inactive receptor kinase [Quercus suber]